MQAPTRPVEGQQNHCQQAQQHWKNASQAAAASTGIAAVGTSGKQLRCNLQAEAAVCNRARTDSSQPAAIHGARLAAPSALAERRAAAAAVGEMRDRPL